MEGNVRKFNRRTRQKYARRARKKNRRHPIEHVIEIIIVVILLVVIVTVLMKSCTDKDNAQGNRESTEEHFQGEASSRVDIQSGLIDSNNGEDPIIETTQSDIVETTEEEIPIPSTSSVWEDPLETVSSSLTTGEEIYIQEIRDEWTKERHFFNLTMGSLDMLLEQSSVTEMTEALNQYQQQYIMSNIIFEADNITDKGTFQEKYDTFKNLITTVKDNLKNGVCVSKRYVSEDYLGYEAPLENALGLVPASYEELADNLKHLKINLNIIPEHIEPQADWIEYVKQLHQYGIAAGIYFPSPDMEYATLQQIKDVYQPIIDAGVDYIVMSEKVFPFLTGIEPATFSKKLMQMLRNEMGFEGVLITADMTSPEIQTYITENQIEEPLIYGFNQGCDIMYVTENYGRIYAILNASYDAGVIEDAKLRLSIERVTKKAYMYTCGE